MKESWKDVIGYEGLYQVSSLGNVKSLPRFEKCSNGLTRFRNGKVRIQFTNSEGYLRVVFWKQGIEKNYSVHRLVALCFVDGYTENYQVNHIDENKLNNNADNLEWVTASYNMSYGLGAKLRGSHTGKAIGKPINQLTLKHDFVKAWKNGRDIGTALGYSSSNISGVCLGRRNTAHGFIWEFAQEREKGEI
jgi:hypothetical protein